MMQLPDICPVCGGRRRDCISPECPDWAFVADIAAIAGDMAVRGGERHEPGNYSSADYLRIFARQLEDALRRHLFIKE